ncbi:hypothetical protein OWI79_13310, partial [Mammaliicoccus sciuri]|uniref:hypothetical protein n=1 Tax=Mammaliicoccus sciuri TaxID=1296 RepID=UPI002270722C
MININTHEQIKNKLVDDILELYKSYKNEVFQLNKKCFDDSRRYTNRTKKISDDVSARRFNRDKDLEEGSLEHFKFKLKNVQEHFSYIDDYQDRINSLVNVKNELMLKIDELKGLNKVTKKKFNRKKDATSLFNELGNHGMSKLAVSFKGDIESVNRCIEYYLDDEYLPHLRGIAYKKDEKFYIEDDYLKGIEKGFFQFFYSWTRKENKLLNDIDNFNESKNYLKYHLL